jgi:hypothetical protein
VAESVPIARTVPRRASPSRDRAVRILVSVLLWAFVLGNIAAIVWLWVANHNLDFSFAPNWWATLWNRLGGLTGLLGGFLALVQVLLLARLPFLGRTIGFDHLTVWHRWNGYLVLALASPTPCSRSSAGRWTSTSRSSKSSGSPPTTSRSDGHGHDRPRSSCS